LFTRRSLVLGILLGAGLIVLAVEFVSLLPRALEVWKPYDYWQYVEMGNAVRQGRNPLGPGRYYPLPTIVWVFIPLSLLPDWFRLVWILVPFVSLLILFRTQGIILFPFVPLWFVIGDAMLDGALLIPLAWLLENRPVLASLGAVAMLAKPQLAILTVCYMLVLWIAKRDWKNLAMFGGALIAFCFPAFVLDPAWPLHLLEVLPWRAGETFSIKPLLTSSIGAWWHLGGLARLIFIAMLLASGVFFWRALRQPNSRAVAFQLINLLFVPVLFASNLIALLPTLRGQKQMVTIVLVSLLAFGLDRVMDGFGGGYAFLPLAALYFQTRNQEVRTPTA
jgi:hypothetical protein